MQFALILSRFTKIAGLALVGGAFWSSCVFSGPLFAQSQIRQKIESAQASPEKAIPAVWQPLAARLAKDGLSGPVVNRLLASFGPVPTQDPMGRKIRELYNRQFYPSSRKSASYPYYKGVVTKENAELCRQYIVAHKAAFAAAEARYGVSPAIACALLFVETRLGKVLGDVPENALYTLASMAVSTKPEDIESWLPKLKGYQKHLAWLDETMRKRADWAYNETKALLRHVIEHRIPLSNLPGSIYGAVGLCQFMPSNIPVYGADGNGDGVIDLFVPADAIASLANYLARHGWKKGLGETGKHKVLMTYNHSVVYANTILALSQLIEGKPVSKPTPKKRGRSS